MGYAIIADLASAMLEKTGDMEQAGADIARAYIEKLNENMETGIHDAAVIMMGEWQDMSQGVVEVVRQSGADIIAAELATLDELIKATEEKNKEMARAEEIANKERAVREAKNAKDREKAQQELNKALAKNELDALKERQTALKQELKEIQDAYAEMSKAIVAALKTQYTEQRDMAKESLKEEVSRQKDALDDQVRARKDALSAQVTAQKEATQQILDQLKREYDALMKNLELQETGEVSALQARIDAIDAQTEAEDRALRQQDNQKRLGELQEKIATAKTDEDRLAAIEKYNEEVAKQQREALLQQRKDEKDSLKQQISQIKESYKDLRDAAKEQYDASREQARAEEEAQLAHLQAEREAVEENYNLLKAALDQHLSTEMKTIEDHYAALLKQERMEAEARQMMIDGDQKKIIGLLEKYTPEWGTAGKDAGEAFLNALKGVTPSIEAEVERIMGLMNKRDAAYENASHIISGTVQGLIDGAKEVERASVYIAGIPSSIFSKYNIIDSPSKRMYRLGKFMDEGVAQGMKDGAMELAEAAKEISDAIAGAFTIEASDFKVQTADAMRNFETALRTLEGQIDLVDRRERAAATPQAPVFNFADMVRGNTFIVRDDTDIDRIADEVGRRMERSVWQNVRGNGLAFI